MITMRLIIVLLVLLCSCTRTVVVEKPKSTPNHAADLIAKASVFKQRGFECAAWTGTGTQYESGVDSFLCVGPTLIMWCGAPTEGPAQCHTVLDWTPPQAPPATVDLGHDSAPEPVKPDAKPDPKPPAKPVAAPKK